MQNLALRQFESGEEIQVIKVIRTQCIQQFIILNDLERKCFRQRFFKVKNKRTEFQQSFPYAHD